MNKHRCLFCFKRFWINKKLPKEWGFCSESCRYAYKHNSETNGQRLIRFLKELQDEIE